MAKLSEMTLQFMESLLNDNPTVEIFTSYFFTDIPANSGQANQTYGNPTRVQLLAAYQARVDKSSRLAGVLLPPVYSDPSTATLTGQVLNNPATQPTGQAGQVPTNATAPSGLTEALIPAISNPADSLVQAGVFIAPPSYKQRVQLNTDVK